MKTRLSIPFAIFLIFFFVGCQKQPLIMLERPESRNIEKSKIELNSKIKIEILGNVEILLGSDKLTEIEVYNSLAELLERRGFNIQKQDYDYLCKMYYKTDRITKTLSRNQFSSMNYSANYLRSGSSSTFNLLMQTLASGYFQKQETEIINDSKTIITYLHTFALEIYNKSGELIWKGDSYIESLSFNILKEYYFPLKLLISNLPNDSERFIKSKLVKKSKAENFANTNLNGFFSSVAIPYLTRFPVDLRGNIYIEEFCEDESLLFAGFDLLKNAEVAIPNTDENDWDKPTNPKIWEKVALLGNYELNNKNVHILLELEDSGEGYYVVTNLKSINDADYYSYKSKRNKWIEFLDTYFDYFQ